MLDTFRGLPVHVLVVHAVVVGVPVMSLVTVLVAVVRRWRARAAWVVVVLDALLALVVLVARQSGHKLLDRVGTSAQIQHHVDLGDKMIWFALALFVAAVLVAVAREASAPVGTVVAVLALLTAVAATGWVVRTGEAGTNAVWKDVIANTTPAG